MKLINGYEDTEAFGTTEFELDYKIKINVDNIVSLRDVRDGIILKEKYIDSKGLAFFDVADNKKYMVATMTNNEKYFVKCNDISPAN